MYKILLVEDDATISEAILLHLNRWGWNARGIRDFGNIMAEFAEFAPQLVLMDIGLPFYNGYYWCQEIRKVSKIPILFLSSASDDLNLIMAVQMGGDDFLAKPFDLKVLTAKIQALLRRSYDFSGAVGLLACGDGLLNTSDGSLSLGEKWVELTRNEQRILQLLLENRGCVVSRDSIMTALWESDSFIDENTLTVNVNRLRRKLESVGLGELIRTRRGSGYLVE